MPVASAFHGLFSDLPVLTVQTDCAFDAKSYDAPKSDIPSPNAVDPQEDDDGPPVLEPIRPGGATWMVSEPVLSPAPPATGAQPSPLAEHITYKPTVLSPIPPLTIGPPLLSSPYDECYSPSSSGYSSADSRCSFFVPSTAAFRSASVLSLPTLPFERLQQGLFNQSAFTPWRNRLPTFHDYPFQQPVAPSTDAFRPASTECSSMTCSTPLSATSFSAFGTHALLHRSPPFFAANSPLSSDEASSSGISSSSSSFSDNWDHGRDHIHGYARLRPNMPTPPEVNSNFTPESPPIIRPEPLWPRAVRREPPTEIDVQPPVLEKCEPTGVDERVVPTSAQSKCSPILANDLLKSETTSSEERSGTAMADSLPTIVKTADNDRERQQTAKSSVSEAMLTPSEISTPTTPANDTSQLRVSPLKIRIPSRSTDRDSKDEPPAKSPKMARSSLTKQSAVEDRPSTIRRKKSSAFRKYGRNTSLKRNSLESSASETSMEDACELSNNAQAFFVDHVGQASPSTSSDYYLSKDSAIPTTPTKRDSFDSDSQKENYDDFRWPPYNMRVRKQSNPSIPVKKPLSKLIRKASTASQKRKESIKETTNVSQPQTPRKRRNSLRPTKFRSNWTPADQGTYQPVILALDAPPVQKLCYEAIRHNRENVVIHVRDCVKVCSSEGLENVGKIMRLYYDKLEKTLMASILWYYTPAQLDPRCTKSLDDCALRSFQVQEKELLASRHVDNVAVDAIESVAYVLTFNQYCRYKAEVRWKEQFGMPVELMPNAPRETFGYRRTYRLPDETTDPDVVYFCRAVYNLSHKRIRVMPKPQLPLKTKPPSRRGSSNTKTSVAKTTLVV